MISCLMVTQEGKLNEVRRSVRDFARQTLPERELVVVHDGEDEFHAQLSAILQQYPDARCIVHREQPGKSLGLLRNVSLKVAQGPLICQWDDDDMYHPTRLEIQFSQLQREEADFCFFTDQLHFFESRNELFWDDWDAERYPMNLIQGTIMGYKEKLARYPDLGKGEDTPVIGELVRRGARIAQLKNRGYLYAYVYNGNNVWDFEHHAAISNWKRFRKDRILAAQGVLARYLPDYNWPAATVTMPCDEGRFVFQVSRPA